MAEAERQRQEEERERKQAEEWAAIKLDTERTARELAERRAAEAAEVRALQVATMLCLRTQTWVADQVQRRFYWQRCCVPVLARARLCVVVVVAVPGAGAKGHVGRI